ncbi:MAG TPA: hypothetical protein VLA79_10605 [Polyangia bacterium]|nr:hypothetical protein [Polyangia bacterium]
MNLAATGVLLWSLTAVPVGARPPEVTIEGASCLDRSELEAALVGLLPESGRTLAVLVELRSEAEALVVEVKRPDGELLAERRLRPLAATDGRCGERVQEIAVVVAAAVGTPSGPEVPSATPSSAPSPDPTGVVRVWDPAAGGPAPERELEVAVGSTVAGGSFAPALRVGVEWRGTSPFGLELSLLYDGQHAESIGRGQALWSRAGATGALVWRRPLGRSTFLDARAVLAASVRSIAGSDYLQTDSAHTFDPGGGAGVKIARRWSRLHLWVGADALFWPRTQEVLVRGAELTGDLARWDLFLGVGATLARL